MKRLLSVIVAFSILASAISVSLVLSSIAEGVDVFEGYILHSTIGNSGSKFATSGMISSYENWNEGIRGFNYRDNWSTQRKQNGDATIILNVTDTMRFEIGTVVSTSKESATYNKYYTSQDGETWSEITSVSRVRKISTDTLPESYLGLSSASYVAWIEQITQLPAGTAKLKIVTGTTENISWQPGIDYIDIYDIDKYSNAFKGYEVVESLLSESSTLDSSRIISHNNWTFGQKGLWYRDMYGTQRTNGNNEDAEIVVSVDDKMLAEICTVGATSQEGVTSNTYYASVSGTEWVEIDKSYIVSKRFTSTDSLPEGYKGLASSSYIAKIDRITALPVGTTQLKIVTSTQNQLNSWWQPSIEYIDLYKHPMDITISKYDDGISLFSKENSLLSVYVDSSMNWSYSENVSAGIDSCGLLKEKDQDSQLVLRVADNMFIETAMVMDKDLKEAFSNSYYASADGSSWYLIDQNNITECVLNKDKAVTVRNLVSALPEGTKYVKVVSSTDNNSVKDKIFTLDYVKLYAPYVDPFDTALQGYVRTASLITAKKTLDSAEIYDYYNWNYGKKGLDFFDEWGLQRNTNNSEDAELILSVTDDTVLEVTTVIAKALEGITSNTYYVSADGIQWSAVPADKIYSRKYYASEDNLIKEAHLGLIERVTALPLGAKYVKIVTSTENQVNSWWQPSIENIDLYRLPIDITIEKYDDGVALFTNENSLTSSYIDSYSSWTYSDNIPVYEDAHGLVKHAGKDSEFVLNVDSETFVETAFVIDSTLETVFNNAFYSSADGVNWNLISEKDITKCSFKNPSSAATKVVRYLISDLPDGTVYVKSVTSIGNVASSDGSVVLDYIKLYKPYIDPFDTVLNGYAVNASIITPTATLESALVHEYSNWNYGKKGMPFFDEWGTQRDKDNSSDAYITLCVKDDMIVEVATVIAKSFEGVTANTYYTSADGVNWQMADTKNLYSRKYYTAENNLIKEEHIGLIERIANLPDGTNYIKIVTSSENAKNSWWQPSINLINLYRHPFDTVLEGTEEIEKLFADSNSLGSAYIKSCDGWSYSLQLPAGSDFKGLASSKESSTLVLKVVDTMRLELCFIGNALANTYYVSKDGVNWEKMADNAVVRRTDADIIKERISDLGDSVSYLKIVSSSSATKYLDYISLYDILATDFDLAFVGYGITHTLFDSTHKLADTHITDYSNWKYGNSGLNFTDTWNLQRNNGNNGDAHLVIKATAQNRFEVATVVSDNWIKKTRNIYYASQDGISFTPLSSACILTKNITSSEDSRIKEGYTAVLERIINLPEGTEYLKMVTTTGSATNSWWQPGIDYINYYEPYTLYSADNLKSQVGDKIKTIQFTSPEDGLLHTDVYSYENLVSLKNDVSYSDGYSAYRNNYKDSQIIISLDSDVMIEFATVVSETIRKCAENKYYTSADGESWTEFDSTMLLKAVITPEDDSSVPKGHVVYRELLSEFPNDTKYVKLVSTTYGYVKDWNRMSLDYVAFFRGDGDLTLRNAADFKNIMIVGNFITITMPASDPLTVDELTEKLDAGKMMIHYLDGKGGEISDGRTVVSSGQKLLLKKNNKVKKEYIISVKLTEDEKKTDVKPENKVNYMFIIIAVSVILVSAAVGTGIVLYIRKHKK